MGRFWHSSILPWLVIIVGLLLSTITAWKSNQWITETEQIRFENASMHIQSLIKKELSISIQLISSTAAFIKSSADVTREEWQQFATAANLNQDLLGFRAIGYAPLVRDTERTAHENTIRKDGFSDYTITQKEISSQEMFPVTYLEPLTELNKKAFGFDLASEEIRRNAIYDTFSRAKPTLSHKVELVTDESNGFFIFSPIYQSIEIPSTIEDRLKNAKGIVYLLLDTKKLFQGILDSNYIKVDFEIYDGNTPLLENKLYDSASHIHNSRLSSYQLLDMYGKPWLIHFKAIEVLDIGLNRYIPFIQLCVGVIFSMILGAWIYALQHTRQKAYRLAEEKTKQLSQSETAIRSIFQTMQEGIVVINKDGTILECNLAAQEMLQVNASELIGSVNRNPKWNVIHEDGTAFSIEDRPSCKALRTGEIQSNIIMGIERKDGSFIWVNTNAQPLFSDDFSEITSVLATFSDITAYRKSKLELERYLEIIDHNVIISNTDINGIITEASEAFCKISGYSKEELIGEKHNIIRHIDIPSSLYKSMWSILKKGLPWTGEIKNKRKDGSVYWVEAIITPQYDEKKSLIGYMAIRHNITDKKRAEELSITDRLTGLYNRLKLDELFAYNLHVAKRHHLTFSIILLDIDNFKLVNDTYGHQVGDSLLQEIAHILKTNVRLEDAVGRWGGEEFLLLLPSSDLTSATMLAEKLRGLIEATVFLYVGHCTASFGVSSYHEKDHEKDMIARADAALYRAKSNGRNWVETELPL